MSRRGLALLLLGGLGCRSEETPPPAADAGAPVPAASSATPPRVLYLPDAGDAVINGGTPPTPLALPPISAGSGACPPEMVSVAGAFCIDRYEASLVDTSERPLSPYYPAAPHDVLRVFDAFKDARPKGPSLPFPPEWQLTGAFTPAARSRAGVVPSGYLSGKVARLACESAGKRLCTPVEWVRACRGERQTKFPYGDSYRDGECNVHREAHPAQLLHGNPSRNHLDPRLNLMESQRGPLLRRTGATATCRSEWAGDAIYDMVGNLDEWVESATGEFLGGFYARATRDGCDARISSHPPQYFDYSLGVRCCR